MLCPRCREVISLDSKEGPAKSRRHPRFLIRIPVALLVLGVILWGAGCSSSTSPHPAPYGKYLVIEKIDYKMESINPHFPMYCTLTATVKNTGSKVVTDIEGYWQLVDEESREYREKIHDSRPLVPGDTRKITMQIRYSAQFSPPGKSRKVVFEKVKIQEAGKSP